MPPARVSSDPLRGAGNNAGLSLRTFAGVRFSDIRGQISINLKQATGAVFSVLHFNPTSWQVERLRQTPVQANGHLPLNSYHLAPDLIGLETGLPVSLQSQPGIAWYQ